MCVVCVCVYACITWPLCSNYHVRTAAVSGVQSNWWIVTYIFRGSSLQLYVLVWLCWDVCNYTNYQIISSITFDVCSIRVFLSISITLTTSTLFYIINYQILTTIVSTVAYHRAPLFEGYEFHKCAEKRSSRKLFSQIYIGDGGRPLLLHRALSLSVQVPCKKILSGQLWEYSTCHHSLQYKFTCKQCTTKIWWTHGKFDCVSWIIQVCT